MRMLATITRPTQGTIRWDDTDILTSPDTLRGVLGYLPQDFGVYPNLERAGISGIHGRGHQGTGRQIGPPPD